MDLSEAVALHEFTFGDSTLRVECRKTLEQTINFRLTVQCEPQDLFESLRDFGGGFPDSEPSSPTTTAAAASTEAPTERSADHEEEEKPDLLGLDIWPASLHLCEYIAANPALVAGATVLELGAGVGLPGLLAAQLGAARVVLTDYEQKVVDHVARNASLCHVGDRCQGLRLDWTKLDLLPPEHRGTYSVLLAADVLYIQDIMPGFVDSVLALLAPGGMVLVGHQSRRSLVIDDEGTPRMLNDDVSFAKFRQLCKQAGLHIRGLGSKESPGFPGPLHMFAMAREAETIESLRRAFPEDMLPAND